MSTYETSDSNGASLNPLYPLGLAPITSLSPLGQAQESPSENAAGLLQVPANGGMVTVGLGSTTSSVSYQAPGDKEPEGPVVTIAFPSLANSSSHWDALVAAITRNISASDAFGSGGATSTESICTCGGQGEDYYVVGRGLAVGIFRFGSERDALVTGVRNNYSRKHPSLAAALAEWDTILRDGSWAIVPPTPGQTIPTFTPVVGLPPPSIFVSASPTNAATSASNLGSGSPLGGTVGVHGPAAPPVGLQVAEGEAKEVIGEVDGKDEDLLG